MTPPRVAIWLYFNLTLQHTLNNFPSKPSRGVEGFWGIYNELR